MPQPQPKINIEIMNIFSINVSVYDGVMDNKGTISTLSTNEVYSEYQVSFWIDMCGYGCQGESCYI